MIVTLRDERLGCRELVAAPRQRVERHDERHRRQLQLAALAIGTVGVEVNKNH